MHAGSLFPLAGSFGAAHRLQSSQSQYLQHMGILELRGLRNPSSPTEDRTHVLCIARQLLSHWTTRASPVGFYSNQIEGIWTLGKGCCVEQKNQSHMGLAPPAPALVKGEAMGPRLPYEALFLTWP